MSRAARWCVLGIVLGIWVVLGVVNLTWSELNQDEGWYLYAARSVAQGEMPYRDFAYTQGPVLPLVYALGMPWISERGVAAGRWITFFFGGLTVVGVYVMTRRSAGPVAALLATMLLAVNVYQSQFTTTVKTYALAGMFLVWGLGCVLRADRAEARAWVGVMGGVLLALAAGTRLSAGAAIPVACLYLLMVARGRNPWAWLWVGIGSGAGLLLLYLPFLWVAPEGLAFGLLEYHAGRAPGGLVAALIYKGGFISRTVQAYFVACALVVGLVLARLYRGRTQEVGQGAGLLWGVTILVSLVHVAAPFPYDDYQVMVYPVLCAALGISLARHLEGFGVAPRWVAIGLLLVSTAAAFSSPVNQAWVVRDRDRIWWRLKEATPLAALETAAVYVRERTEPEDRLLTQDLYLAVAANRSVPKGLEMGPFSYYPDMPVDRAARLRVLNRESLLELLGTTDATMAAVSGYGFAIASPDVLEVPPEERRAILDRLASRYQPDEVIEHFGQAQTSLQLYVRRLDP